MLIEKSDIIAAYEFCYKKKYGNNKYIFKPTETANKKIDQFLNTLDSQSYNKSIGTDWLCNYFLFHFKRTETQSFNRFASYKNGKKEVDGRIQIYDIASKKAVELWNKRDKDFDFTIKSSKSQFIQNYSILLNDFKKYLPSNNKQSNKEELLLNEVEEIDKRRFYNTTWSLIICLERTTLYSPISELCKYCKYKEDCKELQRVNYPKIYNNRKQHAAN